MTLNDLKELKLELDELVQLRENLASTQERCSALLIENRRLTKRIAALEARWAELLREGSPPCPE